MKKLAAKGFKVRISVSGCSNKKNMHRSTYGKKTNYKSNDMLKIRGNAMLIYTKILGNVALFTEISLITKDQSSNRGNLDVVSEKYT